jgi:hypothetical protein
MILIVFIYLLLIAGAYQWLYSPKPEQLHVHALAVIMTTGPSRPTIDDIMTIILYHGYAG